MDSNSTKYRGVVLPAGMTRECLDKLTTLVVDYSDDLIKFEEDGNFDPDGPKVALMAYEIVMDSLKKSTMQEIV